MYNWVCMYIIWRKRKKRKKMLREDLITAFLFPSIISVFTTFGAAHLSLLT